VFWSVIVPIGVTLLVLFVRELVTGSAKSYFRRIEQNIEAKNARELETLKNELRAQANADLERERAGLRILTESYLSRASHLAERRLDVLVKLYSLVVTTQSTLEKFVNPVKVFPQDAGPEEVEKAKQALQNAALQAYAEFYEFAPPNRVYLDDATCKQVDAFRTAVSRILRDYYRASAKDQLNVELWEVAFVGASERLPELIESLRKQIGKLIGVEDGAPKL